MAATGSKSDEKVTVTRLLDGTQPIEWTLAPEGPMQLRPLDARPEMAWVSLRPALGAVCLGPLAAGACASAATGNTASHTARAKRKVILPPGRMGRTIVSGLPSGLMPQTGDACSTVRTGAS